MHLLEAHMQRRRAWLQRDTDMCGFSNPCGGNAHQATETQMQEEGEKEEQEEEEGEEPGWKLLTRNPGFILLSLLSEEELQQSCQQVSKISLKSRSSQMIQKLS